MLWCEGTLMATRVTKHMVTFPFYEGFLKPFLFYRHFPLNTTPKCPRSHYNITTSLDCLVSFFCSTFERVHASCSNIFDDYWIFTNSFDIRSSMSHYNNVSSTSIRTNKAFWIKKLDGYCGFFVCWQCKKRCCGIHRGAGIRFLCDTQ